MLITAIFLKFRLGQLLQTNSTLALLSQFGMFAIVFPQEQVTMLFLFGALVRFQFHFLGVLLFGLSVTQNSVCEHHHRRY